MTSPKRLGLPVDRTLVSVPPGWRTDSLQCVPPESRPGASDMQWPIPETVAAACLIVFARINQPGLIGVKLENAHVSGQIDPQATLRQLMSSLSVGADRRRSNPCSNLRYARPRMSRPWSWILRATCSCGMRPMARA